MSRRTRPYSELERKPGKKPIEKTQKAKSRATGEPFLTPDKQEGSLWDWARDD